MRNILSSLLVIIFIGSFSLSAQDLYHSDWIDFNKNGKKDLYEDSNQEIDVRVEDLLNQMNLDEKTCQMATLYGYGRVCTDELPTEHWKESIWKDGIGNIDEHLNNLAYNPSASTKLAWPPSTHIKSINTVQRFFVEETRLGIPVDFTNEGIRGLCHEKATSFPAQIGIGATWNINLVKEIGRITASEAKLLGYTNVYSPILDLARDPRWGRVVECYGEDPFLVGELGKTMVQAIQEEGIASTPKHFAVYSMPKGGRDGHARTDPHVAERELHSMYLYPFKKAVVEGKCLGIMSSYNDYNGVPVSASKLFLTEILRNQWGFKGYIVSDSEAVEFIQSKHKVAGTYEEGIKKAVEAGLNIRTQFTPPEDFIVPLKESVIKGEISEEVIDNRVREILRVKFELGLFDSPYTKNFDKADKEVGSESNRELAYKASLESIVLLKNEDNILPLDFKKYKNILVSGPNATAINHSISRYGPSNIEIVSVLEGIKDKFPKDVNITYAKGCEFYDENWPENEIVNIAPTKKEMELMKEAVSKAHKADLAILVIGDDEMTVGESRSRTSLNLPGNQQKFVEKMYETGTPVVVVLMNGRATTINWIDKHIPGIVDGWFQGQYGGAAIADVLVGNYNPGGKLPVTFPRCVGQLPMNFPSKPGAQADQEKKNKDGHDQTRVNGVLYPFGYGLSYTTFAYSDLKLDAENSSIDSSIKISCTIENTGSRKGDEIVQLYFEDVVSSVTVYERQLRGFERVSLEPGEKKTVNFELSPEDLALYNQEMNLVVEPGEFVFLIGASSEDIKLRQSITLE